MSTVVLVWCPPLLVAINSQMCRPDLFKERLAPQPPAVSSFKICLHRATSPDVTPFLGSPYPVIEWGRGRKAWPFGSSTVQLDGQYLLLSPAIWTKVRIVIPLRGWEETARDGGEHRGRRELSVMFSIFVCGGRFLNCLIKKINDGVGEWMRNIYK